MSKTQSDPNIVQVRGRLSFPNLFEPGLPKGETDPKKRFYAATFLMDKKADAEFIKKVQERINQLLAEPPLKGTKLAPDKICLRDGSMKDYDGYGPGVMSLSARISVDKQGHLERPQLYDRSNRPITADDNMLYAGCYVDGSVRLWVQNNAQGKRVNARLRIVRHLKDGEPFGGGTPVDAESELPDVDTVEV